MELCTIRLIHAWKEEKIVPAKISLKIESSPKKLVQNKYLQGSSNQLVKQLSFVERTNNRLIHKIEFNFQTLLASLEKVESMCTITPQPLLDTGTRLANLHVHFDVTEYK